MSDAATTGADWDHAPCGLVVARVDRSLVAQNRTLLGWTGREAGAPGRMPELFTVPGALFYETHCAPLLRLQGFVAEISLELRGAGGEPLPVLLSANVRREGEWRRSRRRCFIRRRAASTSASCRWRVGGPRRRPTCCAGRRTSWPSARRY